MAATSSRRDNPSRLCQDDVTMLKSIRRTTLVLIAACGALAAYALATTREESMLALAYESVFGLPDMGPIDFETYRRGRRPNEALACPPGFCANGAPDFDPGVFDIPDNELRRRFTAFVLAQPDVVPVYRSDAPGRPMQDRYVQRSRLMRYPDTINVRFIALGNTTSTLAIHSRSQIGYGDMGVNLARIRLWTGAPALRAPGG
jgi:hypothetical protein